MDHKDTSVAATHETRWGSISNTLRVREIRSGKTEIIKAELVVCSVDCQCDAIQDDLLMGDLLSRLAWPVNMSVGDCLITIIDVVQSQPNSEQLCPWL